MAIDRKAAITWSRDRIKEEIQDLRRLINEFNEEARETQAKADQLAAEIASGEHGFSRSSDPHKHTDGMYDNVGFLHGLATQTESDIDFLKSLL
ncbi:MAG: hypothetical protein K9N55_21025 [Phycisphaerae bacterium]|nr:hypothetical protein [Phycisphaerae bacterium]